MRGAREAAGGKDSLSRRAGTAAQGASAWYRGKTAVPGRDAEGCAAGAAGTGLGGIPKPCAPVTERLSETATFGHHLSEAAA